MNEKEKEIQKALGLLRKYSGYVKVSGKARRYDVYEVQDVTIKGAREQLHKIIKAAQKKSKEHFELEFVVDESIGGCWERKVWSNSQ